MKCLCEDMIFVTRTITVRAGTLTAVRLPGPAHVPEFRHTWQDAIQAGTPGGWLHCHTARHQGHLLLTLTLQGFRRLPLFLWCFGQQPGAVRFFVTRTGIPAGFI